MTNRTLFLLLALGSWALCGLVVLLTFSLGPGGDRGMSRLLAALILLFAVWGIYFFIAAFSKRRHRFGHNYDEHTTFSCPACKAELNYSQFPAFQNEMPCPKCGQRLRRDGGMASGGLEIRFVRSREVAYELATADGSPPSSPVTAEAVRAALAAGTRFTVADDCGGWLVLTARDGPPRWVDGPTPGTVVAEEQVARLTLLPTGDVAAVRPECLGLTSTYIHLTADVCFALASVLGPLRVRTRGADEWIAVDAAGAGLAGGLAVQSLRIGGVGGRP
jgi:hypothetical protein